MQKQIKRIETTELEYLLDKAGYTWSCVDQNRRLVGVPGKGRDWDIIVEMGREWLQISSNCCELPTDPHDRLTVLEAALDMNRAMTLTRFTNAETLTLELDYRREHIDATALAACIDLVHENAEEFFPTLFRLANSCVCLEEKFDRGVDYECLFK